MVILLGIYTCSSDLVTLASFQDSEVINEILFSIPVGDNGIHYSGNGNPDILPGGPMALAVAPDGTFWIIDTVDNQLLHFNSKGDLLNKLAIGDTVISGGDIEVTAAEIWVLDMALNQPKIVRLSFDGKVLDTYILPEGFHRKDGLTGIALGNDGSILVEQEGGIKVTRFISPSNEIKQETLDGYEFLGKAYSFQPGNLKSAKDSSHGYISVGNMQINVNVANNLGSLSILHIYTDGSFLVEVQEMVINGAIQVDQKVYRYDAFGNLTGMARIPLVDQYIPVLHSIAVGPDGKVYTLITKIDHGEVQKLTFGTTLSPILATPEGEEENETAPRWLDTTEPCRSRSAMLSVASEYYNNITNLDSYHINDPSHECDTRTKPPNLTIPGNYSSVPYAWNMWDTIVDYEDFMSLPYNHFFAGDIDDPNSNCARGIDCSGLVSRAWDLVDKFGTCSLETISDPLGVGAFYKLQPGDIVNRCSTTPRYTVIFVMFGNDGSGQGMYGYESTITTDAYGVDFTFRRFDTLSAYNPRRYQLACQLLHLPMISKSDALFEQENVSPNPYPFPLQNSYELQNPYPNP